MSNWVRWAPEAFKTARTSSWGHCHSLRAARFHSAAVACSPSLVDMASSQGSDARRREDKRSSDQCSAVGEFHDTMSRWSSTTTCCWRLTHKRCNDRRWAFRNGTRRHKSKAKHTCKKQLDLPQQHKACTSDRTDPHLVSAYDCWSRWTHHRRLAF